MFYYDVICTVCMYQMIFDSPLHFHVYLITHIYGTYSGSKMDFRLDEVILSLLEDQIAVLLLKGIILSQSDQIAFMVSSK